MAPHRTDNPIVDGRSPDQPHQNEDQTCVRVSVLEAGKLTLPEHFFCADQHDKKVRNSVPSMSFLITHPPSGKRIVFDLGMRRSCKVSPGNPAAPTDSTAHFHHPRCIRLASSWRIRPQGHRCGRPQSCSLRSCRYT